MRAEETEHRNSLMETYRSRFGEHIPLIRRQDVKGFVQRRAHWMSRPLRINDVRKQVEVMELETRRFYERAVAHVTDLGIRKLLGDLAEVERRHLQALSLCRRRSLALSSRKKKMPNAGSSCCRLCNRDSPASWTARYRRSRRCFAAAFATKNSWDAFLVGLAASLGAGISMAFAEALSDDGSLTGRGRPVLRGAVTGLMTAAGGIGHTLPFLIPDFRIAFALAVAVVAIELVVISYVRHRYMDTPILAAAFQVVLGGVLVFVTGILIGSS
jgi:rubrerythrin